MPGTVVPGTVVPDAVVPDAVVPAAGLSATVGTAYGPPPRVDAKSGDGSRGRYGTTKNPNTGPSCEECTNSVPACGRLGSKVRATSSSSGWLGS